MIDNVSTQTVGLIDRIKEKLSFDWLSSKLNMSSGKLVEILYYLGIGFILGFLFKKYFKHVLLISLVLFLTYKGLVYIDAITIEWNKVYNFFGLQPAVTLDSVIGSYFAWVKANIVVFLTAFIGFLIGAKVA